MMFLGQINDAAEISGFVDDKRGVLYFFIHNIARHSFGMSSHLQDML